MLLYNIIYSMMLKLRSELQMFYLDDGGSLPDALNDLQMVKRRGFDLVSQLSHSTSQLICEYLMSTEAMLQAAPGLHVLNSDDCDWAIP